MESIGRNITYAINCVDSNKGSISNVTPLSNSEAIVSEEMLCAFTKYLDYSTDV